LVVDDEFTVNALIRDQLKNLGYEVVGAAYNGLEAIEHVSRLCPDAVVMDLQMPDPQTGEDDRLAGLKAAQGIQGACPTPVVLLTAHASPDLVERAGDAGVGAYLVKPTSDGVLGRAITIARARFDDLMALRRATAELQAELDERKRVEAEREKLIHELQEALARVKTLSGLLPICASCKKIRDDQGYWHQVEVYFRDRSDADFSHSLCPDCARQLYPDLYTDDG
jgi:AmiR/NasT family two-component response regulator